MVKDDPLGGIAPGVKITAQMSPEATEGDFQFVRQMGLKHAVLWTDATNANVDYVADAIKDVVQNY